MHHKIIIALAAIVLTVLDDVVGDFNLLILHTNDMHGRFEETEPNSGTCQDAHRNKSCIGGFARIAHEVKRYRQLAKEGKGPEVLFLNAGDTYVGTVWYSLFTSNISAEFINMIQPDVINHVENMSRELILRSLVVVLLAEPILCKLNVIILHTNDMHSRFEETESNSGTCQPAHKNVSCYGGFARLAHEVRRYKDLEKKDNNTIVLFLNAGDNYVGTAWYTLYKAKIVTDFINIIQPDAISLGNHEFDGGVEGLAPFVNSVNCPIVAANLDFTNEPTLAKIQKSVIITRGNVKIGIVGYLTKETVLISNPGKVIFNDEIEAMQNETTKLMNAGVDIIIALGHSGYLIDQKIAAEVTGVNVVVGGHSNTFLWNGPQPDTETVDGPYPTVVTRDYGKKVLVVQAYAYTKYLGILNVSFNHYFDVKEYSGQPELLSHTIPQDKDVLKLLDVYRPEVIKINKEVVGKSRVTLDGDSKRCRSAECNFGNLIADSLVSYKASVSPQRWTIAPIGLMNGGGIRNTIDPVDGTDITRGDLMGAIPFGNTIITMVLNGSDLIKTLEIGARSNGETSGGEFLQVSGLRVVYNMSRPSLSRVLSVKARCGSCNVPTYYDVELKKNYTIITTSFLEQGGDNHYILKRGMDKHIEDLIDLEVLVWYFKHYSPVFPEVEGRITFQNGNVPCNFDTILQPTSVLTIFACATISFIRIFNHMYLVAI